MRSLILLLLIFSTLHVEAQVVISGKVTNQRDQPVGGVSVSLKDTYDGATTDSAGNFSINTSEKGKFLLEFSSSGFKSQEREVLVANDNISINVNMKELVTELQAVVITAGAFEASDEKKTTVLNALDIVTTASAEGDITGALKTLPGTQQVGESEGLFVRGGTATESKIFIDGGLVNNFFYSSLPGLATRGRFNPFLFKGTVFSAGGYSALYGQALSSALILESKDLPERTQGDISISVIGVGGGIQKLSKDKRSSWGATYSYTNIWLAFKVVPQKQDFYSTPVYHQADLNFRQKTKRGGFWKYYGYFNWNKLGFRANDIDSSSLKNAFALENLNTYHSLSLKEKFSSGWRMNALISYSNNRDDISNELQDPSENKVVISDPEGYAFKNFAVVSKGRFAQARLVIEKRLRGLSSVRFGGEHFISRESSEYTAYDGAVYNEKINDNLTSFFGETDIYLNNNLAMKAGGRIEYSALMKKWNVAPRLSIAQKLGPKSQVSFAYGIFYQNPESKYLPASSELDYAKASHYILQFQKQTAKKVLRIEAFYKDYDDLFKTGNLYGREEAVNNNGYGYAKGLELFWRDRAFVKDLDYWISYSYLDTERDFLSYPEAIRPSFAAQHTASLVLKKFVLPLKTNFNASYNFASGRPYYQMVSGAGQSMEIRDRGETKSYNSLSFSVNYLPAIGKKDAKTFTVWVLSLSNVLGQEQVFGYNYGAISGRKSPILPGSKRFAFIGCFISFGIDRTQDVINNNL